MHMDCHIRQLRLHRKAEVQKKPTSDPSIFGNSEYGVNGHYDLWVNLSLSTVHYAHTHTHQLFFLIFLGHEKLYNHSLLNLPFLTAQSIKLQYPTLLKISWSLSVLARLRYPALCNKCKQCQTTNVKLSLWIINKPPSDKTDTPK